MTPQESLSLPRARVWRDNGGVMFPRLPFAFLACARLLAAAPLPVRGIRLSAPLPNEVQRMTKFIREVLVKEGVNTLVLEINYRYQFQRHPEVADADALSLADARAIAAAARESGRLLGIGYYRRLYPKVRRAAELLAAGAIGRPVLAFAAAHNWFDGEGGHRAWLLDPAMAGGGPLYDTACHRIDLFNLLFGQPAAVTAQLSNVVFPGEVEDAATVLIDYECGVRGIVDARRHSRVVRDEFRVIGTEGEIDLSPLNGPELVYPGGAEELPPHENLHYPLVEDFVSAVLEGTPLASSGETALPTDWVIGQAAASAGLD